MPGHSDAARPIQGRARVCQLDWFINSRCDYACRHCVPGACGKGRRDVDLAACRKVLRSFLSFCAAQQRQARIAFFPRQAEFVEPFLTILRDAAAARRSGRLGQIVSANRGDLPADKIRLFADAGVDACRLTIDGPKAVQDFLRRPGSFRDTLTAFRAARDSGIRVIPLLILVRHNAPHVARTMRMLLDDGFDGFTLQVGIRGDAGTGNRLASVHPEPLLFGMRIMAWWHKIDARRYPVGNPACKGCIRFMKNELKQKSPTFRWLNDRFNPVFNRWRDSYVTSTEKAEARKFAETAAQSLESQRL